MKSEKNILLVVNPISGNLEKEDLIVMVEEKTSSLKQVLTIMETTGEDDEERIKSIINEIQPIRVIVAGGDGTVLTIAKCIYDTDIVMGIIPAGSANGLAVNFNIPDTLEKQIEVAFSECFLKIDALFLNDKMCLHIADLGMNAELIKNFESSGIRGKFGYFLQTIPTIFKSDSPYEFEIETSEGVFKETGILLAIANANKFGTGATINPNGKMTDGLFEILIFKKLDFIEILKTLQDNPEMSSEFMETYSTDKATIKSKKEVPFQIDGEYLGLHSEIKVKIEKQKINIALPEQFCKLHAISNT